MRHGANGNVGCGDVGVGDEGEELGPLGGGAMPGGSHPPFTQVQSGPGRTVRHGVDGEDGLDGADGVVGVDGDEVAGACIPGGSQLPSWHVPPPRATNGSGVVHDVGAVDVPLATVTLTMGETPTLPAASRAMARICRVPLASAALFHATP